MRFGQSVCGCRTVRFRRCRNGGVGADRKCSVHVDLRSERMIVRPLEYHRRHRRLTGHHVVHNRSHSHTHNDRRSRKNLRDLR